MSFNWGSSHIYRQSFFDIRIVF